MTKPDIAEIAARHQPLEPGEMETYCTGCSDSELGSWVRWPCDVARLLALMQPPSIAHLPVGTLGQVRDCNSAGELVWTDPS